MLEKRKTKVCERCGYEIQANDPHVQYTLTGQTHTSHRCVQILLEEINKLKSKRNVKS